MTNNISTDNKLEERRKVLMNDSALKLMNENKNIFLSGGSSSRRSVLNLFRESNPSMEILESTVSFVRYILWL